MAGKVIVIYSGGLDSTTLLYHLRAERWEVKALSVDYGQRHREGELGAAEAICASPGSGTARSRSPLTRGILRKQ